MSFAKVKFRDPDGRKGKDDIAFNLNQNWNDNKTDLHTEREINRILSMLENSDEVYLDDKDWLLLKTWGIL